MTTLTEEITPRGRQREPELDAVVTDKTAVAAGVVSLTLAHADGDELPAWEPGAHVDLVLANGLVRQYSLCGDPRDRTAYRLGVLRERDGGGGSEEVHDRLATGDQVRLRGPRNHFALAEAPAYTFIAGGIGITPILPMIRDAERRGAEWTLLYGGRRLGSMAFLDELEPYGNRVKARPEETHGLLDLDDALAGHRPETLVYGCGPEPLLAALESACARLPPGTLHVERFAPKQELRTTEDKCFEVVLRASERTLQVGPDQTILECVEAAGIQVLSSCQQGTCGTCETDVIDGDPEHRDSVLTEKDRACGETMMICVSRCQGDRMVLDL